MLILLCLHEEVVSGSTMLILTVIGTLILIIVSDQKDVKGFSARLLLAGAAIGKRSYSIYIWHQIIVAFMFYSFFPRQSMLSFCIFVVITIALSLLSYRFIEVPLGNLMKIKRKEFIIIISTFAGMVCLCFSSFLIYRNARVVRDVPELNVYLSNVHRGMHAEYCDRPYLWNKDFEDDDRINVLVIGNSFGRDWANILYEWDTEGELEISYSYFTGGMTESELNAYSLRIEDAKFILYATGGGVEFVTKSLPYQKLFVISDKSFGTSNGIVYAHRYQDDYYEQFVEIDKDIIDFNNKIRQDYNECYIDMMQQVMIDNTHVRVFTDDNKFISQDCRHLTQAGAQYYARTLGLNELFSKLY